MSHRLVIVANRLPLTFSVDESGALHVKESVGGVATALKVAWPEEQRVWIGWPGDMQKLAADDVRTVERECARRGLLPVRLTKEEVERYYEGCSNAVLWPVFHNRIDRLPHDQHDFDVYRAVNDRFAEVADHAAGADDIIWVHDYQLCLTPMMVRRRRPKGRIAFFLHIPFPPLEVFSVLPDRQELVEGLLGADVVGFHTGRFRDRFLEAVRALVPDAEVDGDGVAYQGRRIRAVVAPLGVESSLFAGEGSAAVDEEMTRMRAEHPELKLILGVDRMDYTKGIPRRMLAMEKLLELEPSLRGKVQLVQIAVPSRENVEAYAQLQRQIQEIVGRVNGKESTLSGAVPIRFLSHGYDQHELVTLYRHADVMLVTPLVDGMNLVAKEFIASRIDGDGVLVLSEFAGAAEALGDAVQVNPYDIAGTARALLRAVQMPEAERRARMKELRAVVDEEAPARWARELLAELPQKEQEEQQEAAVP